MRHAHFLTCVALVAATGLSGCGNDQLARNGTKDESRNDLNLASGTSIEITLDTQVSSKTASVGDAWTGSARSALVVDGSTVVPAGSPVTGTVTAVRAASKGDRAMLDLGLTSITVANHRYDVRGGTEPIIAGSTRARNLGAIGAGTAAGAIVGQAVGGSTKSTVIGAVVGGGTATGVVAASDGYQVVLKSGTPLTFTTSSVVAVRP